MRQPNGALWEQQGTDVWDISAAASWAPHPKQCVAATSSHKGVTFPSAQALPCQFWRAALKVQAWHTTKHIGIRSIQLKDAGLQQHHMPLGAMLCLLALDSPHQHGQNDRVGT